mmetsp:Transcript_18705/g.52566  ORF Transcript_18705/g.52566 Transcript_18705/m.52566 type:complete len:335 (-) Transcript_18705:156-1160(-)|eukprot:CAMPEP_0202384374 /NCGR_PEP_ID=MMETSP1127-20130417/54955_1 /ASSEMBLY_ACC=CAM_ASM_000462 /TAXON_ID=3047 /ORGANISM="Dunaliella tertiolecta, Strain CCMP1320" /LENGTH=334 /DNA_ID=CAMNT_0048984169 /DNA_START=1046 /DNA_END=2050 /DNA_ORIENTATION=-
MLLHQQGAFGLQRQCRQQQLQSKGLLSKPQSQRHISRKALVVQASTVSVAPKPQIMVNSMTGKMGQAVADATRRAGLQLVPYTLCASDVAAASKSLTVDGQQIELVGPETRDAAIGEIKEKYPNLIMVDYTVPDVIHSMADFYVKHRTPFVMGTTGGDRVRLLREVDASNVYAVIAPNMGKQIVAFQAMFEQAAASYPGAFSGYKLRVIESHQSTKKDTSGTAKAVVASLNDLGLNFDVSQIELVREPKQQMEVMKVPESALGGHAFHTYQLVSEDGSVAFEFKHNVIGRATYAEGTVDACLFLAMQMHLAKGLDVPGRTLFNMTDVLRAGAMR